MDRIDILGKISVLQQPQFMSKYKPKTRQVRLWYIAYVNPLLCNTD